MKPSSLIAKPTAINLMTFIPKTVKTTIKIMIQMLCGRVREVTENDLNFLPAMVSRKLYEEDSNSSVHFI